MFHKHIMFLNFQVFWITILQVLGLGAGSKTGVPS